MIHPIVHTILYGEMGTGKSTTASTYPKPLLVFCFDPFGKDMPYLKGVGEMPALQEDASGIAFREILNSAGDPLLRIEYYHEQESTYQIIQPESSDRVLRRTAVQSVNPSAYVRFLRRMGGFQHEYDRWATVVVDSVTMMELVCRKMHQYVLNPTTPEPRQWFAGSTDQLEEILMLRFAGLPMNTVVIAHVDEDKDELHGNFIRNPAAPGRLRKRLTAGYGEVYRAHVKREMTGERVYLLQTRGDQYFPASSQIDAPDPCEPYYDALWVR